MSIDFSNFLITAKRWALTKGIDNKLHREEIEYLKNLFPRDDYEKFLRIKNIHGKHVLSDAKRIIVPDIAKDEVSMLIK